MKHTCQYWQEILAEHGPEVFRYDDAGREHLEECESCFAVLEALAELDRALPELPLHDAPDEVVSTLLTRPELSTVASREGRTSSRFSAFRTLWARPIPRGRWRWAAAGSAVVTVTIALTFGLVSQRMGRGFAPEPFMEAHPQAEEEPEGLADQRDERLRALGYLDDIKADMPEPASRRPPPPPPPPPKISPPPQADPVPDHGSRASRSSEESPLSMGGDVLKGARSGQKKQDVAVSGNESSETSGRLDLRPAAPEPKRSEFEQENLDLSQDRAAQAPEEQYREISLETSLFEPEVVEGAYEPLAESPSGIGSQSELTLGVGMESDADGTSEDEVTARETARRFLHRRGALEGLRFQPASGYWANTYIPGDPALRHLEARLLGRDRSLLQAYSEEALLLHEAARTPAQPFDPPTNAALAVYLHADRSDLRGETRMLVQVGLQATASHGGRRPAMKIALVLDAEGMSADEDLPSETAAVLRALVSAFSQARDLGDRFHLVISGGPSGLSIDPEEFRHGPLKVALDRLFVDPPAADPATPALGLPAALRKAIAEVRSGEDPTAPLGSSAVVLLTARRLGDVTDPLRRLAHESAVEGVPVSVIGVGDEVDLRELDDIALHGQGHRRWLRAPREAQPLVERELIAVSEVVARAVRLRVRLAPGVRLVDVIGSRRLDEAGAARVREAERSIDQRLSRNLGIEADRGEDEAGIQIVIPSFYAGDSHVVLLDVVASGPGKIADVRVRYKDLVHLENGVARAHLSTGRAAVSAGDSEWSWSPLERNVLKNLLAFELKGALEEAGESVARGSGEAALERLRGFARLLEGLRFEVRGFEEDRDLERDAAMVGEYVWLLSSGATQENEERHHLADSMRYAGQLKVLARLLRAERP